LHPTWIEFLGVQPYWPLFWLLPWSTIHGSSSGAVVGLFLGLTLDSLAEGSSFTQIPGLILCGFWFGKIRMQRNFLVGHFRNGLICSIGSFLCGIIYTFQIFFKNVPEYNSLFIYPSLKNILAQIFLTGLFAPLICSQLQRLFLNSRDK